MDYRKLIKEEIAKLHTAKGVKANPKLDSDLGEEIVASICRRVVKNCRIVNVSDSFTSKFQEIIYSDLSDSEIVNALHKLDNDR